MSSELPDFVNAIKGPTGTTIPFRLVSREEGKYFVHEKAGWTEQLLAVRFARLEPTPGTSEYWLLTGFVHYVPGLSCSLLLNNPTAEELEAWSFGEIDDRKISKKFEILPVKRK